MAAYAADSARAIASLLTPGDGVLRIALVVVVLLSLLAAGLAVWLRVSRRHAAAALEQERARHTALRGRNAALEALDLTARRLAATGQHAQIADHAARAAEELFDACEVVLRIPVAEDLTVTVRRTIGGDPDPSAPGPSGAAGEAAGEGEVAGESEGADADGDAELVVEELADLALLRRAPVRAAAPAGDDPHHAVPHRIAIPLRHGDGMVGVFVLGRPAAGGPFDAADASLVERLTAHIALAVARSGAHVTASRSSGAQDPALPSDRREASGPPPPPPPPPSPPSTPEAAGSACDLVAVVGDLTVQARAMAQAQGQPRRVAVLAPRRAVAQLPEAAARALIREVYELVTGATEPGSNLAVELLAHEDSWELVVAHGGEAISTAVLEASPVAATVRQLGGEVASGQGAGVARIRIMLLGSRVPGLAGSSAVPLRLV